MKTVKMSYGTSKIIGENKDVTVEIETVRPKSSIPEIILKRGIELYYVVEGSGKFNKRKIKKGDYVLLKKGKRAIIHNTSTKTMKLIIVTIPKYEKGKSARWLEEL